MATGSMPSSARIWATAIGWVTYGSPVARFWPAWASTAKSKARSTSVRSALGWCSTIEALSAVRRISRSMPPPAVGSGMAGARRGPRRDAVAARGGRGTRLQVRRRVHGRRGHRAGRGFAGFGRGVAAAVPLGAVVRVLGRGVVLAIGGKDSSGSVRDRRSAAGGVGRGSGAGRGQASARTPSPRGESRASARSSHGVGPSGPMIDVSWPLPASRTMSPGRAASNAASIAARRSAMSSRSWPRRRPAASAPRRDLVEDRLAVLAAWILVGDDHQPAALAGDAAHLRRAWPCRARRPSRTPRSARRRGPPRRARGGRGRSGARPGCGRSRR